MWLNLRQKARARKRRRHLSARPMKEQTMRSKHVTQSDVTLNLETCKKLVEVFVKDNKCEETFRLRDVINLGTKTNKTSHESSIRANSSSKPKGFGATMLLVGRSAFGDQNLFGKMFYVGTLPLFCTQYSPCPVCVYNPPKEEHKAKSYQ